jgi:hypothetical protein
VREDSLSADDLAIRAAKEKLAQLRERDGYLDALALPPPGTRVVQTISLAVAAALAAVTAWEWGAVGNVALRWSLSGALVVAIAFALLMAIGSAPRGPTEAWPAAVLAVGDKISLLRDDGATRELRCHAALASALRAGDVGIARVRDTQLVELKRL